MSHTLVVAIYPSVLLLMRAYFDFLSTGQEIGWEQRLQYDLFIVSSGTLNFNSMLILT